MEFELTTAKNIGTTNYEPYRLYSIVYPSIFTHPGSSDQNIFKFFGGQATKERRSRNGSGGRREEQ